MLLDSLERDRDRYTSKEDPRIAPPNLIIVSGDIVQGVKHGTPDAETKLRQQYDEALQFLNDLTGRFVGGDRHGSGRAGARMRLAPFVLYWFRAQARREQLPCAFPRPGGPLLAPKNLCQAERAPSPAVHTSPM